MTSVHCPQEYITFAHRIADAVGEVHRRYFRNAVGVQTKADTSPVTDADRESEQIMRQMVQKKYPNHGIIGEEFDHHQRDAEFVWVIDPIDGTDFFISGKPMFALLLALAHNGRFILGVVDQAILHERWLGADGHGTLYNGRAVHTRHCPSLAQAIVTRPGYDAYTEGRNEAIDKVAEQAWRVQWGITPYDYGLIASGYMDLMINSGPKVHDLAPIDPIVRNAGGKAVDWNGKSLNLESPDHIIVGGDAALVDAVLAQIHRK
jgi:inositol-phosphate phosphatase/L-galactose 1-phosphate phosphatase/histidinol-phosphatase